MTISTTISAMYVDVVVADAGPLISLARIGRLALLESLFGKVLIPEAVWNELTQGEAEGRVGAHEIQAAQWIEVRSADRTTADAYELLVDRGEAEAIALASAVSDCLLLIDDRRGRRVARERGIRITGTIGVLVLARRRNLLSDLPAVFTALKAAGVHVAADLIERALRELE